MIERARRQLSLTPEVCVRALRARDARFDGLFFVGITSTGIYCRPICPARVSRPDHRRFFDSAAGAERAGFRPCRRCRPELAPGRTLIDAVSRLARAAAYRIAGGGLNGRSVRQLADELCVSDRHLRRALKRELGVSPVELAQTHRLLMAKRLLTDTPLPVTRVAYASGFQSLRRFNVVFRERYGMSPSMLREAGRPGRTNPVAPANSGLRLTLAYRAPFDWEVLMALFRPEALPGVERVQGQRFSRTVRIDGHAGVISVEDAAADPGEREAGRATHLNVDVSPSLLPVLMPLIARLRRLFDLDAQPAVVNACLARGGLAAVVRRRPGVRIPGAFDGFEVGLHTLVRGRVRPGQGPSRVARRVVAALGEPIETGIHGLTHLAPGAARVAETGAKRLTALGLPARRAETVRAFARAVADGTLGLEPESDVAATRAALMELTGVGQRLATTIVMRALAWPDAFPWRDPALRRAASAPSQRALRDRAEAWRPWRAYAAVHLRLQDQEH